MNPVIFEFGPFALHWYGLFIVGGAVIAAWIGSLYAVKAGEDPDHIWNILAVALIFGIIGARLYHVVSTPADGLGWAYYRENPGDIFNFWNGGFRGLGIYGGLLGGIVGITLYCMWQKLNPIQYLDFIAPNVVLAQAIGRMGNFVNQELYGPATDRPWAFHINPAYPCQIPKELPQDVQYCGASLISPESAAWYASHGYHPTFFYEAIWNVLMFGLMALIIWKLGARLRRGDGILMYLIAYPLGRFWVEMFRPDAWVMGTLATAQWIAIACIVVAIILMIIRHVGWHGQGKPQESMVLMSGQSQQARGNKKPQAKAA